MATIEERKQKIHRLVDNLPPEQLGAAEVLLEKLRDENRVTTKDGKSIVRLGGLWKGVRINEEDIDEERKEIWGSLGEDYE